MIRMYWEILMRKPATIVSLMWILGGVAAFGSRIWHQDVVGQQEYLRQVAEHWVTLPPIVGAILTIVPVMFGIAILRGVKNRTESNDGN